MPICEVIKKDNSFYAVFVDEETCTLHAFLFPNNAGIVCFNGYMNALLLSERV